MIALVKQSIEVYANFEEFFQSTGWARDNPEIVDAGYLLENFICQIVDGQVWYFSRLRFEEGLQEMLGQNCD